MVRIALRLASLLPLLALTGYVAGLEPSVPFLDHGPLFDLYHAVATGQAGWRDFVSPHNGIHVIVAPRLFLSALALATDWTMSAEIWTSLALVLVTFIATTRIAAAGGGPRRTPIELANLLTALLLCSPVAYWSWVWTCGFFHFLMNACVVLGALALVPSAPGREARQVAVAALFCLLATFTRAEGIGLWFVLAPALLQLTKGLPRRRLLVGAWWSGASISIALVTLSIALLGDPATADSLAGDPFDRPFARVAMVLSLVGLAFGSGLAAALLDGGSIAAFVPVLAPIGALVSALFVTLSLVSLWRRVAPADADALPWISIGALGAAFVVASGAIRFGVLDSGLLGDFWPSNYATSAALISVAVVHLLALRASRIDERRARGYLAALAASGMLITGSWTAELPDALDARSATWNSDLCFEVFTHLDELNSCFGRRIEDAQARRFEEVGFRTIRRDLRFDPATRGLGAIESERPRRIGGFEATGWVRDDGIGSDPVVFISRDEGESLFALAVPTGRDGDRISWRAAIYTPTDGSVFRAWRYDRDTGSFDRLDGRLVAGGGEAARSGDGPDARR